MALFFPQSSFLRDLIIEKNLENYPRQVLQSHASLVRPKYPPHPEWVHYSDKLSIDMGIADFKQHQSELLEVLSGSKIYPDSKPFSMCYGGHQFGHWAGQLGDGRAINLFEHQYRNDRYALQLKGAGKTPYSRTADGLAVLRSSIREHLCSEAMHFLDIPTTRSLSLILTGNEVVRDMFYDGHPRKEKGAVVCRVAPSFIRFGNFEIFTARNDIQNLKRLVDYTIREFFPQIKSLDKEGYLHFFQEVSEMTLSLILHWQRVGFVHGVMNTDNMSILGLTIDFGPYGWLEGYDPSWTPNTTDADTKRYRFENQPDIALWNLLQLANALYPLIEDIPALESILSSFYESWTSRFHQMMNQKLGLVHQNSNSMFLDELNQTLILTEVDYTIFFRKLSSIKKSNSATEALLILQDAFYRVEELQGEKRNQWTRWLEMYLLKLNNENRDDGERKKAMNQINPKYIFRNYMAQLAIDAADRGDYSLIQEFYELSKKPYDEQPDSEKWFSKRPEWARTKAGCSMLSCSS